MNATIKKDLSSQEQGLFSIQPLTFHSSKKDIPNHYRGRFAPSPSGPLHFGSLVAALASYCQAKKNNGTWLIRMEDIDPPREQIGADQNIIHCLYSHGLISDEPIVYQSQRIDVYQSIIDHLYQQKLIFYCNCSRKTLRAQQTKLSNTTIYPGTCRERATKCVNCSTRVKVNEQTLSFVDGLYGEISQNIRTDVGDFVLRRRDGLYSYQLAVVIDDIAQGITEVVRGVDLLTSTPRQLYLYQVLKQNVPKYLHLPLALMKDGKKLSKQTGAKGLDNLQASDNLVRALQFLGQDPIANLKHAQPNEILNWAVSNWHIHKIKSHSKIIS